ncbi:MAG TPA: asparaginase [Actinoplanes sp.]|nr:asparaginase [Actinoplanes sp.]
MPRTPRIMLVGMGGTIARTGTPGGGVAPGLTAAPLGGAVPGLAGAAAHRVVHDLRNRPGAALTLDDLTDLAAFLDRQFRAGVAGAVVTQGTDTIEESAYVLDLLHSGPQPIVVTGALRNPTQAGPDGPANLLAAVTVAASPAARDLGCVVAFADEIHAAARVRKTHTMSVAAFASPTGGALGYLVEGRARILNRPARRYTLPAPATGRRAARVGLYPATVGDDGDLLPAFAAGLDGLVVAGFGAGHVPETWVPHLAVAARRIPVVLASRTGAGFVATGTYGFAGSERDLIGRGLIPAGMLDPYKARILLHLLLTTGADPGAVRTAFAAAGAAGDPAEWTGARVPTDQPGAAAAVAGDADRRRAGP